MNPPNIDFQEPRKDHYKLNHERNLKELIQLYILTHSFPMFLFIPPENIRKPEVFWCFQGVKKRKIRRKCVNKLTEYKIAFNPLIHNVSKWSDTLQKSCKKEKKICFNELFSLKLINLCAFRHTRQFSFSLTLVFYAK